MITQSEYIRIVLRRKGMNQQDLVDKLNENRQGSGRGIITKQRVSNLLNGISVLTPSLAREIEIALELEENTLVVQK